MTSLIPEDLSQPGTHALVIGVSRYLHFEDGPSPTQDGQDFGMEQLSAAAKSASEFAVWLLKNYRNANAPLRSLRVLLSPSPSETLHPLIAAEVHGKGDVAATRPNVESALVSFRKACSKHGDNVAIVYVAGHGVQMTKNGAIVLLSDFGDDQHAARLTGAIDMAGVHAGMNHPGTARTQFWFIDACRQKPAIARKFETLEGALKLDIPNGVTETSPLFLSAITGTAAYARVGGVTLFNEALMAALNGAAGEGPRDGVDCWHIPVTALIKQLPDRVRDLAKAKDAEQSVDIAGKIHEAVFHEYDTPPKVDLHIDLQPDIARVSSSGTLKLNATQVVLNGFTDWPLRQSVDAGLYLLNVAAAPPFLDKEEILRLDPPSSRREIVMRSDSP